MSSEIKKLMKIETVDVTDHLVIEKRAREWCKLPYPDHPEGCPSYDDCSSCPPDAPHIENFIDLGKEHQFIVNRFNIKKQEKRMLKRNPNWTKKQARCLLYWQSSVEKRLKEEIKKWEKKGRVGTTIPEAMGVNVFKTARNVGIPIKRIPETFVYKIALVGFPQGDMQESLDQYL